MNRLLLRSSSFIRAARRTIKKHPHAEQDIHKVLGLLSENAFNPLLKTHKLKGNLKESWACSAGYDLRVIFKLVQYEGSEAILLESLGSHEEVY